MDSLLSVLVYGIVAVLVLFILAGIATFVAGVRSARQAPSGHTQTAGGSAQQVREQVRDQVREPGRGGLRDGLSRYVGPVRPHHALLNPPARVGVEATSALFGFPGLGWLISGKVVTGLALVILGPSLIWGLIPIYLIATGQMADEPYLFIEYLPFVSIASASALAFYEFRLARGRREKRIEAPN